MKKTGKQTPARRTNQTTSHGADTDAKGGCEGDAALDPKHKSKGATKDSADKGSGQGKRAGLENVCLGGNWEGNWVGKIRRFVHADYQLPIPTQQPRHMCA